MSQLRQVTNREKQPSKITHSKVGHNKNPIVAADIMRNKIADLSTPKFSLSQISEAPTSKAQVSEISHNMVGYKKMCLFRTDKLRLSKTRQRFSSHLNSHSRQRFNMMLEERPRHAISLILSTANI